MGFQFSSPGSQFCATMIDIVISLDRQHSRTRIDQLQVKWIYPGESVLHSLSDVCFCRRLRSGDTETVPNSERYDGCAKSQGDYDDDKHRHNDRASLRRCVYKYL